MRVLKKYHSSKSSNSVPLSSRINQKQAKTNSLLFCFSEVLIFKAELCLERRSQSSRGHLKRKVYMRMQTFLFFKLSKATLFLRCALFIFTRELNGYVIQSRSYLQRNSLNIYVVLNGNRTDRKLL